MTDTRTTSTSLGTTTDGSFLIYESGEGDLFDSTLETFESDTKTTLTNTTRVETEPGTIEDKAVEEGDDGVSSADHFTFDGDGEGESDGGTSGLPHTDYYGTDGADTLEGGDDINNIYGYGGNDTLYGNGGQDKIYGGDGADTIFGGANDDTLIGGANGDTLYGGTGYDRINGGSGYDDIFGDSGNDQLYGGSGQDTLYGGFGRDYLYGDAGADTIFGGAGNDYFEDNAGDDVLTGGDGANTFRFSYVNIFSQPGGGNDRIEDFEIDVDTLKITNSSPEYDLSFNDYIDQYASGGGDTGVVIEWENGLIRLPGIEVADLNPWDVQLTWVDCADISFC